MEIKCWGSRGSVPVSGKNYLKYGGDTTCIEITAQSGHTIIVDAGTGIRNLGNSLIERDISEYYLLFTHAHWDHVLGFPFFRPLLFKKNRLFIQDRKFSGEKIDTRTVLKEAMKEPFFPIGLQDLSADLCFDKTLNHTFDIGSIGIETIPLNHPGGGFGYKFTESGRVFVFLTDNEIGFDHEGGKDPKAYIDFIKNADLLFHDGEYTLEEYPNRRGWGHSAFFDLLEFSVQSQVKKLGIFHHNQDRTDREIDAIEKECRAELKKTGSCIDCFAVAAGTSLTL